MKLKQKRNINSEFIARHSRVEELLEREFSNFQAFFLSFKMKVLTKTKYFIIFPKYMAISFVP